MYVEAPAPLSLQSIKGTISHRAPICSQELFGPLSMRALEEDQYVRQTEGYLPDAAVAFIDEIFKANSAILNTLLTVLNERLFDNGSARVRVPLLCLVRRRAGCMFRHGGTIDMMAVGMLHVTLAPISAGSS